MSKLPPITSLSLKLPELPASLTSPQPKSSKAGSDLPYVSKATLPPISALPLISKTTLPPISAKQDINVKETSFKSFPKDVVDLLSRELSPSDLIKFCGSQMSDQMKTLCNSPDFWLRRFQKDFPFLYQYIDRSKNIKKMYLQVFSKISKQAEATTKDFLEEFGDFTKYLNAEYKKDLYNFSYQYVLNVLQHVLKYKEKGSGFDEDFITEYSYELGVRKFFKFFPPSRSDRDLGELLTDIVFNNLDDVVMKVFDYIGLKYRKDIHETPRNIGILYGSPKTDRLPPSLPSIPGSPL
jgi:hypothetical protein